MGLTPLEEFKKNLDEMKDKISKILKGDADKFIQIAANYVEQNQGLLEKNRASLYNAIIKAAQNGLYIDGEESALVPFKGDVKFMSMYKGLLKQVRNSGELASINCGIVYENDVFEYFVDENGEHLKHIPNYKSDRGKIISTFCIARTKGNNAPYIEIMTEDEIQACKKQSRAGNDSPWNGPFVNEMRKKTIIHRIRKRLPASTDFDSVLHADDDLFIPQDEPEDQPQPPETSSKLSEAVTKQETEPKQETKQGEYKEGVIDELKIFDVKIKGQLAKRYGCRIGDDWFGTFDLDIYKEMCNAADNKSLIWLIYEVKTKKSGDAYNEALGVKVLEVPEDEVPI